MASLHIFPRNIKFLNVITSKRVLKFSSTSQEILMYGCNFIYVFKTITNAMNKFSRKSHWLNKVLLETYKRKFTRIRQTLCLMTTDHRQMLSLREAFFYHNVI